MSEPREDSVYAIKFAVMQQQINEKDKRIKELEEENTQLEAIKNDAIRRYNFESISKQKIKDKIEEIENAKRETTRENWHYIYTIQLKILEELLEENK